jgi:hypothetical protein
MLALPPTPLLLVITGRGKEKESCPLPPPSVAPPPLPPSLPPPPVEEAHGPQEQGAGGMVLGVVVAGEEGKDGKQGG